jgi:hypothetical protein
VTNVINLKVNIAKSLKISDHESLIIPYEFIKENFTNKILNTDTRKNCNFDLLNEYLQNVNWDNDIENVGHLADQFVCNIKCGIDNCTVSKKKTNKMVPKPWFKGNPDLFELWKQKKNFMGKTPSIFDD